VIQAGGNPDFAEEPVRAEGGGRVQDLTAMGRSCFRSQARPAIYPRRVASGSDRRGRAEAIYWVRHEQPVACGW
jgi:hypothetical protein